MQTKLDLKTYDVEKCDIMVNANDIRRDLHIYINYVRDREVKRTYRSNALPKADEKRLLKLMGRTKDLGHDDTYWSITWLEYVERLALAMGWVAYDTEGVYAGYSSQSPSFPDNYIHFMQEVYGQFLAKSPREQELRLLHTLINLRSRNQWNHGSDNEFYRTGILGILTSFNIRGCATGVMPSLNFPEIRRFLFDTLSQCEHGIWYDTTSLVAYLKANYPYFLIPHKPELDRWGRKTTRYGNFYEQKDSYSYPNDPIPDDAPDGFERVEGRYVERFLEGIPLTLGYVDVAYTKEHIDGYPSQGKLRAFRVNQRFLQLMNDELTASKVTVQPNFEIQVEAVFYPLGEINRLLPFSKIQTEDRMITLKLDRQIAAASLAEHEDLDPIATLNSMTDRPLPQNIRIELEEWIGHADVFTIYTGFALHEGQKQPQLAGFTEQDISQSLRIVRSPDLLYRQLLQAELAPMLVKHGKKKFTQMPAAAMTIFPQKGKVKPAKRKTRKRIILQRETHITLHVPSVEVLEQITNLLVQQRCLFTFDERALTITYPQRFEEQAKAALKALRKDYIVRLTTVQAS